jgi:hypothetical protein
MRNPVPKPFSDEAKARLEAIMADVGRRAGSGAG